MKIQLAPLHCARLVIATALFGLCLGAAFPARAAGARASRAGEATEVSLVSITPQTAASALVASRLTALKLRKMLHGAAENTNRVLAVSIAIPISAPQPRVAVAAKAEQASAPPLSVPAQMQQRPRQAPCTSG